MDIVFIEVNRVITEPGSTMNTSTVKKTYNVADIRGFREWKKGKNDVGISGDMVQLVLTRVSDIESSVVNNGQITNGHKGGVITVLIEESYNEFKRRLSERPGVYVKNVQ